MPNIYPKINVNVKFEFYIQIWTRRSFARTLMTGKKRSASPDDEQLNSDNLVSKRRIESTSSIRESLQHVLNAIKERELRKESHFNQWLEKQSRDPKSLILIYR